MLRDEYLYDAIWDKIKHIPFINRNGFALHYGTEETTLVELSFTQAILADCLAAVKALGGDANAADLTVASSACSCCNPAEIDLAFYIPTPKKKG